MSKHFTWSGRIIVDQRDRARGIAGMVSDCIAYYEEHDQWQNCLMTGNGGTSNQKWVWYYEILKTGTMKISCWLDRPDKPVINKGA